jgi:oligo-1,6-glucosidase
MPILEADSKIYACLRCLDNDRLLIILNFCRDTVVFELPEKIHYQNKELLISNYCLNEVQELEGLNLKAYEARVYRLK